MLRSFQSSAAEGHDSRFARRQGRTRNCARSREAAMPAARIASYASTGDRAFVSDDGRTTFALVDTPPRRRRPGPAGSAASRRRHSPGVTVGGASVGSPGWTRSARPETTTQGTAPECSSRRCSAALGALLVLVFVFRSLHGGRAAADGGRRHPDDVPPDLADRDRHGRLGDRAVPRRADRARDRDRLRAADRRPLERRTAAARHDERPSSPERDAARRLRCRLQRHHRRHLTAGVARGADSRPSQHRDRRPPDRAGQRRCRRHAAPRRACHGRPEARLAAQPARRSPEPCMVFLGTAGRPVPLARGCRVRCRPRCARRCRVDDSVREPARKLARAARGRPASRSTISPTPESAAARSRRSTRS